MHSNDEFIRIDGSYGEGGGQILRTAVALSIITSKPIEVSNIRAKRPNPGLRAQHVTAINVLADVFNAKVENARIGSSTVRFIPSKSISRDNVRVDIGTAGSITLVLQALIPAVSISGNRLTIELIGGTDVRWSPSIDYVRYVLKQAYSMLGIRFNIEVKRRGYYPVGNGLVYASIEPCSNLSSIELVSAPRMEPSMISICSNLPKHVADRQIAGALALLESNGIRCRSYSSSIEQSSSPGSSILVYASSSDYGPFIGGDAVGERGKRAEDVGREAAMKFIKPYLSNVAVDPYLADMLVVPLSMGSSVSRYMVNEITMHLSTNLHIASMVTGCEYSIKKMNDNQYLVSIVPRVSLV
jgi:RNA 3'-terminal phosphate cyclase (ATP)